MCWELSPPFSELCSGSVDNLGLGYQDVPIKVVAPWKIGQMRARGQVASCPSNASPGQGKTKTFLLLMACSSFRNLMKNYLVLSSHVVIRQMRGWKRRPTKQPYLTGLYFLSIIHGVRITLLITVVSTLHGFFFSFDQPGQWPEKTNTPRTSAWRCHGCKQFTPTTISSSPLLCCTYHQHLQKLIINKSNSQKKPLSVLDKRCPDNSLCWPTKEKQNLD